MENNYITTLDYIPKYEVEEILGIVTASKAVKSNSIPDEEAEYYSDPMFREVMNELQIKAKVIGANAVIGVRIENIPHLWSSKWRFLVGNTFALQNVNRITIYGTAVKIAKKKK